MLRLSALGEVGWGMPKNRRGMKKPRRTRMARRPRLTVELVPGPSWETSVRSLIPSGVWDRIRRKVRAYPSREGRKGPGERGSRMRTQILAVTAGLALAGGTRADEVDTYKYRVLPSEDAMSEIVWWKSAAFRCAKDGDCPLLEEDPKVETYFGVKAKRVLPLRLKASWEGSDWIFLSKLVLKIDGRLYTIIVPFNEREGSVISGDKVWEKTDIVPDALVTAALCKAQEIKVRFSGSQGYDDHDIPSHHVWTIRETCRLQKSANARKEALARQKAEAAEKEADLLHKWTEAERDARNACLSLHRSDPTVTCEQQKADLDSKCLSVRAGLKSYVADSSPCYSDIGLGQRK